MIQSVLVLGAGSAGLLAALSLKRKIPSLAIQIVRSPEMASSALVRVPRPISPVTFSCGDRATISPTDSGKRSTTIHWKELPRPDGYYCDETFRDCDLPTALMAGGKVFARQPNGGGPDVQGWHAFHIENKKLVDALEAAVRAAGVEVTDGKVCGVERRADGEGVAAVTMEDGRRLEADFFVDASGFRSEMLGRALEEAFPRSLVTKLYLVT